MKPDIARLSDSTFQVKLSGPEASHFTSHGERVTKDMGIIKVKDGNGWLIFHIPSQKPVDGYYFRYDMAVGTAKWWGRNKKALGERLETCRFFRHSDGDLGLWWN